MTTALDIMIGTVDVVVASTLRDFIVFATDALVDVNAMATESLVYSGASAIESVRETLGSAFATRWMPRSADPASWTRRSPVGSGGAR